MGTVMDGDCGIDVMGMMLQRPQTAADRREIRQALYKYVVDRWEEPWLHDLLARAQEISWEAVEAYRTCGAGPCLVAVADDDAGPADEVVETQGKPSTVVSSALEAALQWSTGLRDPGTLALVAQALPPAVREEQVREHTAAKERPAAPAGTEGAKRVVYPHMLKDRPLHTSAFDEHAREQGWQGHGRLPWNASRGFCQRWTWPACFADRGRQRPCGGTRRG